MLAGHAHAAIINWASAVSGTASTATRWNPVIVPAATDDLVFNATAGTQAYSVTFDAATATSRSWMFNQDSVTLNQTVAHTVTNGITIGDVSGNVATVTIPNGTWNSTFNSLGNTTIAEASGSTGTLNITDDTADFIMSGANASIDVGNGGTGTLNITGGGLMQVVRRFDLGVNVSGVGNVTVSGVTAGIPVVRSTLRVTGLTDTSRFGGGGDATVSIANGALVHVANNLEVAATSTSTSTVTIGGTGGILNSHATLDVDTNMTIGRNETAQAAGAGTVTVNNGGDLLVAGGLSVGNDAQAGTGTLNINIGALVQAFHVNHGPFGTINHNGGTLQINGGNYTGHPVPLVVSGTGSPTLRFSNNSVNTLTAVGGVGLRVGDDLGVGTFTGNLIVDSGADVILSGLNNDISIGDDAGTTGIITVTGVGSRLIDNQAGDTIFVGRNGTGELRVESGGEVLATEIQVPASSLNGDGLLVTSTSGSTLITTSNLSVGNALGLGSGVVTLNPATTLNATSAGIGVVIRATGDVGVGQDALLNATGTVLVDGGDLNVIGTVQAGTLVDVASGGVLHSGGGLATCLVDALVRVRAGGVVEAVNGGFTLGKATVPGAVTFDAGSTLRIGSARTCTLLNATSGVNVQMLGILDMQGGTLACDSLVDMAVARLSNQITGFGTIDSDMRTRNNQACTPTGSGLVFERNLVLNNGFNANGTAIRFGPNATLSEIGSHTMNCKVTADAGSVMRPTNGNAGAFGPITMGDGTSTGVTLNGIIHMGTNGSLTLNDTFSTNLGTLTDMNGGSITNTTGLNLTSGCVLRGRGTLNVGNPSNTGFQISPLGTIDPDAYFSDTDTYHGIGTFTVNGRYAQATGGVYLCEIAGFNSEFQPLNDRIDCGPAALAGTLDVSLIDGYEPKLCHEFTIMNYTSRTGTWNNIVSPPGVGVGVRYEATRAVLFFNSLECNDIDFNNDGSIFDPQDIDAFLSVYSEGPCIPAEATCDDVDFNNDCSVFDPQDIDSFLSVFSEGPCIH